MSAITAFIDGVKERIEKASPSPWYWEYKSGYEALMSSSGLEVLDDGSAGGEYVASITPDSWDARLIAHAPHDLKLLIEMLEVALGALEKINNFYVDYELGELGEEAKLSRDALKQIAAMAEKT